MKSLIQLGCSIDFTVCLIDGINKQGVESTATFEVDYG